MVVDTPDKTNSDEGDYEPGTYFVDESNPYYDEFVDAVIACKRAGGAPKEPKP
ncbi:MAG: hypothetical protein WB609_05610 [Candidatus Cybelea sp.]